VRRGLRARGRNVALALPYVLLIGTLIPIAVDGRLTVVGPFLSAMQMVGLILAVVAARRTQGRAARPWWLLALSWALLGATSVGFTVSGFAGGNKSNPASAVFMVAMTLRGVFGVVLFAALTSFSHHLHGRARRRLMTDAVTLTGAGLMIMWYFLLGPALSDHQSIGMARLTTIFLPISDLTLVLGTVVVLLSGSSLTTRRSLALLLAGVISYLLLDSLLVAETVYRSHFGVPMRLELFLLDVPPFLFAAASAEHCRTMTKPDDAVVSTTLSPVTWLPQAGLIFGFALLATIALLSGLYPWPGLIAGAIIMTVGVAVRQSLAVQENRELALTDTLTRLPNRAKFTDMLNGTLNASHRTGIPTAVLLIDLNEFKPINDQYGHETGDEVLVAFAAILRQSIRRDDQCARLGGDEFAVIIREVLTDDGACDTARRILAALADSPIVVGNHTFFLRASIGIAVSQPDQSSVDGTTLIRRADEAMYAAKRAGNLGWQAWTASTARESEAKLLISSQPMLYQPIHDLTGQLVAVQVIPGRSANPDDAPVVSDWMGAAATHLNRWRLLSPAHRDLRLYVTARPEGPASVATLQHLDLSELRPADLIIDITPLAPFTDDAALGWVRQLRTGGALTAIDTVNLNAGKIVEILDAPIDLVLVGHRIIGKNGTRPQALTFTDAAIRIGQALRSNTDAPESGRADAIDALLAGARSDPALQGK